MFRKPTDLTRHERSRAPVSHADMLAKFRQAHGHIAADNQRYQTDKTNLNAPPPEEPEGDADDLPT